MADLNRFFDKIGFKMPNITILNFKDNEVVYQKVVFLKCQLEIDKRTEDELLEVEHDDSKTVRHLKLLLFNFTKDNHLFSCRNVLKLTVVV